MIDYSGFLEYYQAKDFLTMQLHILRSLGKKGEFYDRIKKFYQKDHEFCLMYMYALEKHGSREEAVKKAEEGVSLFPGI